MPGRFILVFLLLGSLLVADGLAAGDDSAQLQQGLRQLLQVGWTRSRRAAAEAESLYARLQQLAPADARVPYAHALVQIKQGRFSRAGQLVSDTLALAPDYTPAWQAKLWLLVLMKKYSEALALTDRLVASLTLENVDPRSEVSTRDTLARLGTLFAFMEGLANSAVDHVLLARQKERLLAPLSEPHQEAFQEGHRRVTERRQQLQSDQNDAQSQAEDAARQKKQQLGQDIEQQQQGVNRRLATLAETQTKTRQELQAELKEIQEAETPLVTGLAGLQRQAQTARREVLWLEREIQSLYGMLEREDDAARQSQLRFTINRADNLQRRYARDLRIVEQEMVATQSQIQGLHHRRAGAQRQYDGNAQQIENQRQASLRQQKRIDGQQKRLLRPQRETSARARGIATRAKSLTTYAPFPLDVAKEQLIDSLR